MHIRLGKFLEKPLYKISEKILLLKLSYLLINRGSVDDTQFNDLLKIEMEILKNSLMLSFANIGIVIVIFFWIHLVIQEYMKFN